MAGRPSGLHDEISTVMGFVGVTKPEHALKRITYLVMAHTATLMPSAYACHAKASKYA